MPRDKLALYSDFSNLLRHWFGNKCWDMNKRHLHFHRVREKKTLQNREESYTCWHFSFFSVFSTSLLHLAESLNSLFQWITHMELSKPLKSSSLYKTQGSGHLQPWSRQKSLKAARLHAQDGSQWRETIINHKGPFLDNLEHKHRNSSKGVQGHQTPQRGRSAWFPLPTSPVPCLPGGTEIQSFQKPVQRSARKYRGRGKEPQLSSCCLMGISYMTPHQYEIPLNFLFKVIFWIPSMCQSLHTSLTHPFWISHWHNPIIWLFSVKWGQYTQINQAAQVLH